MGLRCDFSRHAFEISDDGRSAGTPEKRAHDLHTAFADPSVSAVLSAVGGLSSHELLPHLDADHLRNHPKAFIGRSDNTFINAFLYSKAGITSYTGATFVTQFGGSDVAEETLRSIEEVLLDRGPLRLRSSTVRIQGSVPTTHTDKVHRWTENRHGQDVWLQPGRVEARLVGGEVSIIADLLEQDLLELEGTVLWIDILDDGREYANEMLGRLWSLLNGVHIAGVIVADNPSMLFEEWVTTIETKLQGPGPQVDGPVLVGGDVGHYQPAWLMPYGDLIVLDSAVGITINR